MLCDVVTPTSFGDENLDVLYGYVDKALYEDPGIARKHGVDSGELQRKVRDVRPGTCLGLVDAIERFWRAGRPRGPRLTVLQLVGYGSLKGTA